MNIQESAKLCIEGTKMQQQAHAVVDAIEVPSEVRRLDSDDARVIAAAQVCESCTHLEFCNTQSDAFVTGAESELPRPFTRAAVYGSSLITLVRNTPELLYIEPVTDATQANYMANYTPGSYSLPEGYEHIEAYILRKETPPEFLDLVRTLRGKIMQELTPRRPNGSKPAQPAEEIAKAKKKKNTADGRVVLRSETEREIGQAFVAVTDRPNYARDPAASVRYSLLGKVLNGGEKLSKITGNPEDDFTAAEINVRKANKNMRERAAKALANGSCRTKEYWDMPSIRLSPREKARNHELCIGCKMFGQCGAAAVLSPDQPEGMRAGLKINEIKTLRGKQKEALQSAIEAGKLDEVFDKLRELFEERQAAVQLKVSEGQYTPHATADIKPKLDLEDAYIKYLKTLK